MVRLTDYSASFRFRAGNLPSPPYIKELGDEGRELVISTRQLCEYLDAAETMVRGVELLGEHALPPEIKKRKRSETPPEEINSSDEARYVEQEERAAKRIAESDSDYGIT
ncbi:unnamed protein product [Periconia digitata]|uniref:Uncharacterized protein n=1 Tax=Periconia digitata TaxID=1303443 RepID=A0A9W4XNT8_9PLEO|nr:unnamed protein product [Periconia digitata]